MRHYWVDILPTNITIYTTDILELKAATDKPILILSLNLHQTSDFGDAQDEVLSLKWERGNTSSGNGTSVTPSLTMPGDPAASFLAERFGSTAASGGTTVILARHCFNVRGGLERPYTPEERFGTSGASYLCLRFEGSPADGITVGGSVLVGEMG